MPPLNHVGDAPAVDLLVGVEAASTFTYAAYGFPAAAVVTLVLVCAIVCGIQSGMITMMRRSLVNGDYQSDEEDSDSDSNSDQPENARKGNGLAVRKCGRMFSSARM